MIFKEIFKMADDTLNRLISWIETNKSRFTRENEAVLDKVLAELKKGRLDNARRILSNVATIDEKFYGFIGRLSNVIKGIIDRANVSTQKTSRIVLVNGITPIMKGENKVVKISGTNILEEFIAELHTYPTFAGARMYEVNSIGDKVKKLNFESEATWKLTQLDPRIRLTYGYALAPGIYIIVLLTSPDDNEEHATKADEVFVEITGTKAKPPPHGDDDQNVKRISRLLD